MEHIKKFESVIKEGKMNIKEMTKLQLTMLDEIEGKEIKQKFMYATSCMLFKLYLNKYRDLQKEKKMY